MVMHQDMIYIYLLEGIEELGASREINSACEIYESKRINNHVTVLYLPISNEMVMNSEYS